MRIFTELLELGPVLALVFADNALVDPDIWHAERKDPLEEVISPGYADGTIDPELSPDWITAIVCSQGRRDSTAAGSDHEVVSSALEPLREAWFWWFPGGWFRRS